MEALFGKIQHGAEMSCFARVRFRESSAQALRELISLMAV